MEDDLFYLSSTITLFLEISNSLLSIAMLVVSTRCEDPARNGDGGEAIKVLQPFS